MLEPTMKMIQVVGDGCMSLAMMYGMLIIIFLYIVLACMIPRCMRLHSDLLGGHMVGTWWAHGACEL